MCPNLYIDLLSELIISIPEGKYIDSHYSVNWIKSIHVLGIRIFALD